MFQVLASPNESTNVRYATENVLIFHDILSTSSLRKFVKISWIFWTKRVKITEEKRKFLLCKQLDQREMTVPSPDIKIVPSIITFMLNTPALE